MSEKMKVKKGTIAIYVVALMLVTAGYWSYLSKETAALETMSAEQNTTSDENLGDAELVSNNEVIKEENQNTTEDTVGKETDDYFEESKLSRDKCILKH